MTQWTVYKHVFESHLLEFIVSVKKKAVSEHGLKKSARLVMKQVTTIDVCWTEFLKDVRRLMELEYPRKEYRIQLWLDRDKEISFWDDGCP